MSHNVFYMPPKRFYMLRELFYLTDLMKCVVGSLDCFATEFLIDGNTLSLVVSDELQGKGKKGEKDELDT